MLVVETIAKIRRAHFVQGKAIKAISRELKGLRLSGAFSVDHQSQFVVSGGGQTWRPAR
jgi:hypothetical protein